MQLSISKLFLSLAMVGVGMAALASFGIVSLIGIGGALLALGGSSMLVDDALDGFKHRAVDSNITISIQQGAGKLEPFSFSLTTDVNPQDRPLTPAQVNALVVDHAEFFENEVNPFLPPSARERLDGFLKRAGDSYAKDSPAPTTAQAREVLGHTYGLLPEGHEKKELRAIMDSLSPSLIEVSHSRAVFSR